MVRQLLDRGDQVIACLNPEGRRGDSQYHRLRLGERCEEHRIDLTQGSAAEALLDRTAPDAVIHMASFGDLARCLSHPRECFDASAVIGMRLLEAVRRSGRPLPFLNHSTDKVYAGHPTPFRETMPLRPANIYELSKATQDQAGQVYARSYGLPVVTIRCGNYFGPYENNFTRIVPYVIRQNLAGEEIVLRSSGRFTRDFLYVEDAAALNLLLLDRLAEAPDALAGEVFNFSLEVQLSVLAVVERICSLMQQRPRLRIEDTAREEIPDMRLDCRKARESLGWSPAHGLDLALAKTIAFSRQEMRAAA